MYREAPLHALDGESTAVKTTLTEYQDVLAVSAKELMCNGVMSLTLRRPDGGDLPRWAAGAHIDLQLPNGLTRQYSLCGHPDNRTEFRVCVLNETVSRGGSRYVHDNLAVGDRVQIRGPRNNFSWVPAPRYLFIAGGIGITPIIPMIIAAEASGADWKLAYAGRRRDSMAFLPQLSAFGKRVHVADADGAGRLDLGKLLGSVEPETLVYCCGPERLMIAVEALAAGWPEGVLHLERFKPVDPGEQESSGFEIELRRSGKTLKVSPDKSILKTIQDAGLIVPCSCEEGTCGTCETNVIEGIPDHRDSVLSAAEKASNRVIMICVSRSKTERLVVDL
ncbi:PDR/VanB family oxidoreductase [Mesorhizobium sp. SP-1A]|uniref:PDR/VanB family oxidoreductase n=1 Tax=Mesorhizobium sp. SP-1A TaxID=3077840 RepID=UPI0028F71057|nr:PDR/VanB family oxidoreductase [Mesorhizobium sp. SP-1A]